MQVIVNPEPRDWAALTARPQMQREVITERVANILKAVRTEGDHALLRLTEQIDGIRLETTVVTADEIAEASLQIDPALKEAIEMAARNIRHFHAAQRPAPVEVETMPGVRCLQRAVPLNRVGLYIPGGSAPLFSTVLMLAIPARIAGCNE